MSWRDKADTTENFKLSMLSDGDRVSLTFRNDGEEVTTEHGDATRFEVTIHESDAGEVPEGEASLLTSSTRFFGALAQAAPDAPLTGRTFGIQRAGERYDTQYIVEDVTEEVE